MNTSEDSSEESREEEKQEEDTGSPVDVYTRPLLHDALSWRDVKVLRELQVSNRREYETFKGELIEHHEAPPNSLLYLRSKYELLVFYISTQPAMSRAAIYLNSFYRTNQPYVWR